jgi:hypothetical protein
MRWSSIARTRAEMVYTCQDLNFLVKFPYKYANSSMNTCFHAFRSMLSLF